MSYKAPFKKGDQVSIQIPAKGEVGPIGMYGEILSISELLQTAKIRVDTSVVKYPFKYLRKIT